MVLIEREISDIPSLFFLVFLFPWNVNNYLALLAPLLRPKTSKSKHSCLCKLQYPPNVNKTIQIPSIRGILCSFWLSRNCLRHLNSLAWGSLKHLQDLFEFSGAFILPVSSASGLSQPLLEPRGLWPETHSFFSAHIH